MALNDLNKKNKIYSIYLDKNHSGEWCNHWNSYDSIIWEEGVSVPSESDFNDGVTKTEEEYDALQYHRDREPEYPSIADQLDYIYHNGIAKWKSDMVKPVKDAHPKP